ncbi:hypothetical protein CSKR_107487 [Clonorchis sinensis]|uniref:Uncharacterized protein n=1 Tax=Clonorchis sinensis TaxID=79923 RepID=A0A3R7H1Q9_CLOSI|nr:hypothetical protein CSKR_107487 [Clonorchis sinensis]
MYDTKKQQKIAEDKRRRLCQVNTCDQMETPEMKSRMKKENVEVTSYPSLNEQLRTVNPDTTLDSAAIGSFRCNTFSAHCCRVIRRKCEDHDTVKVTRSSGMRSACPNYELEIAQRLRREHTDRMVHSSTQTWASRLLLSTLGNSGSIYAQMLPSGGTAARHQKGATTERLLLI